MKIYFVGIHNKPGLKPLCSSTKTGKTVDAIICEFPEVECIKTNLSELEEMPPEPFLDSLGWHDRFDLQMGDVVILLGAWVHKNFRKFPDTIYINLAHPASVISHVKRSEYLPKAIAKIKKAIAHSLVVWPE